METKLIIKCVAHQRPITEGCSECLSPDAWDLFERVVIAEFGVEGWRRVENDDESN